MRLCHNMNSLKLYNKYSKNLKVSGTSINNISSGIKISRAKDNPDKIGQSESMKIKIRSMQIAQKNMQDGSSMLQAADGALQQINDVLSRVKELTVNAANGSNTEDEKQIIQTEIDSLLRGIDDMANNTEFNGIKLIGNQDVFSNDFPKNLEAMTGAEVGEVMKVPMYNVNTSLLLDSNGKSLASINVLTQEGASEALATIDEVISSVSHIRSQYGAISNKFESCYDRLTSSTQVVQTASSRLTDADIAEEMLTFSKSQILYETQIALMAQSNQFPMDALKVLDKL